MRDRELLLRAFQKRMMREGAEASVALSAATLRDFSALTERLESHVHDILRHDVDALTGRWEQLATDINLVAETHRLTESRSYRANERLDLIEVDIANLKTKTAHLPFPAAPATNATEGPVETS